MSVKVLTWEQYSELLPKPHYVVTDDRRFPNRLPKVPEGAKLWAVYLDSDPAGINQINIYKLGEDLITHKVKSSDFSRYRLD